MRLAAATLAALAAAGTAAAAELPGPADPLIEAPASRIVAPAAILRRTGTGVAAGDSVTYDFGREVGGLVSLDLGRAGRPGRVALSFTESPRFIGPESDSSAGGTHGHDGALTLDVQPGGTATMPQAALRGGFRYLTITAIDGSLPPIRDVRLAITFSPDEDLRRYGGYFRTSDPLLERIWYAGAYTLQTNVVATDSGRAYPFIQGGWNNAAHLGVGRSILVDGAKRDRAVWPGDMGIALPSMFVSTGDLRPARNALETLFDHQDPATGALPECGPPLLKRGSDTYHLWTLIGAARYLLYSGDVAWMRTIWPRYRQALAYSTGEIGADGLLRVAGARDWGRRGQGGENLEANALLFEALRSGADVARTMGDAAQARAWDADAAGLQRAIDAQLWDAAHGAYRDNPASTLDPQDGNALAVWYGVATDPARQRSILALLRTRWNRFGAVSVELPATISPFVGSMEVMARFAAGDDGGALALIRREWGYMLADPDGTHSTLLEGYLADGSLGYRGDDGYLHDPSYVSHAHGWSTGPTAALTFDVLGLQPVDDAGRRWRFAPHPGDLRYAAGAFTTKLGVFRAAWSTDASGALASWRIDTPRGTSGTLDLPASDAGRPVLLDGRTAAVTGDAIDIGGGRHVVTFGAARR